MIDREKLIMSAVAAFLTLTATQSSFATTGDTQANSNEKCYGVARAKMNDCATSKASCAGSAVKDAQGDAFLFVPSGLCEKLVGGHLQPVEETQKGSS